LASGLQGEVKLLEGLIIIGLVLLFFKSIAKRAKELQEARQDDNSKGVPIRQHMLHEQIRQPVKTVTTPVNQSETATEGVAQYQIIQPMVMANRTESLKEGSRGLETKEGMPSTEGMDTCDPSLAHDRWFGLEAYLIQDEEKPTMEILPQLTDANVLVQSFVMSEILNRPHRWGGYLG